VLNGFGMENGRHLATYVEQSIAALDRTSPAQLRNGTWRFPPPAIT
jgi:hypothetical protein